MEDKTGDYPIVHPDKIHHTSFNVRNNKAVKAHLHKSLVLNSPSVAFDGNK